jgi:hypothetical protein
MLVYLNQERNMNTMKFPRGMLVMMAVVFALMMAACSPSASPTAAPGASSSSAGDPAGAVKTFYETLFTGGDASSFVCSAAGVDAATLQESYKAAAAAFANAKIDTSGMTFTASNVTADKADVAVSGNMNVDMAGVKQDVPMNIPRIPVVLEGGSWKICG